MDSATVLPHMPPTNGANGNVPWKKNQKAIRTHHFVLSKGCMQFYRGKNLCFICTEGTASLHHIHQNEISFKNKHWFADSFKCKALCKVAATASLLSKNVLQQPVSGEKGKHVHPYSHTCTHCHTCACVHTRKSTMLLGILAGALWPRKSTKLLGILAGALWPRKSTVLLGILAGALWHQGF